MASSLVKPLAIFCKQSQSQRYIKTIRNLGDAWRSLAEEPLPESDATSILVETNFDLIVKIKNAKEEQSSSSSPVIVEISTREPLVTPNEESSISEPPRHYRIFADWGTDFIWRDFDDLRGEEGDCMLEAEEILCSPVYPPSVFEHYDAWVETYTENFNQRRNKTGDFHASTFANVAEEVAWNVAGYLLAWRIAMAPDVGSIEFSAGVSKYTIEKGNETRVTLSFLQDQVELLGKGKPVA
ncbi:hypothetical protein BO86DRAFT_391535 [Aspergillus japonicus CBS 114.51]|uniref:Uncharacterized protein n=2 Tax=Aspergillus TaxID=5052 RepID=A0A2V5GZC0_ASPV1|nr:hypothetical protein BO86DRAFT_391535 [Aspergillus japonicus CBS 114.51]PYI16939.1 hypothetical protein BO99DRAFT_404673 [Aspergillus violaceofuscus CBS 115571]RAH78821.1 hypothetical protein BO86DRAFT_391535 [Aspergillus japonicus CBS 114.51]